MSTTNCCSERILCPCCCRSARGLRIFVTLMLSGCRLPDQFPAVRTKAVTPERKEKLHVTDSREDEERGFRSTRGARHGSRPGSPLVRHRIQQDQTGISERRGQEGRVAESTRLVLRRCPRCARQDSHVGVFRWTSCFSDAPGYP